MFVYAYVYIYIYICRLFQRGWNPRRRRKRTCSGQGVVCTSQTKKHSPNTGARANNTLHTSLGYPIGEPAKQGDAR